MSLPPKTEPEGVLIVDKAQGLTSHDVVGMLRRALGTREIGHTGTLDPIATGVLILLVGEATKLASYLTATDKVYETTLRLGQATDSLDADGVVLQERPVPALDRQIVQRAILPFLGEIDQRVPDISAVKVDGKALHKTARKGREVAAPTRRVTTHAIDVLDVRENEIDLRVACSKGFYVRSLGRDLAEALGTVGHLSALKRTKNGPFTLDEAVPFERVIKAKQDPALRDDLRSALMPLATACQMLPTLTLSDDGVRRARVGQRVLPTDVMERRAGRITASAIVAMDTQGTPIALMLDEAEGLRVARGFRDRSLPVTNTP